MKFLNKIADEIENYLKLKQVPYEERGMYNNHYIEINGKKCLQKEYIPVFTFKDGDIGINIDGIFFEIMIDRKDVSVEKIKKILFEYPSVKIYGYDDCLNDFYKKGNSSEEVIENINKSTEKIIQFNIQLSLESKPEYTIDCFDKFLSLPKDY